MVAKRRKLPFSTFSDYLNSIKIWGGGLIKCQNQLTK
jgi:hypothetical protein